MKALLICKGPGATILAKEDLNKYDFIAWANWNNYKDKTINIPTRVDKLYLYDYTYITEIPSKKLQQFKKDLKVKSVKIVNSHKKPSEQKTKKWLDALCKCWDREYENFESEVNYTKDPLIERGSRYINKFDVIKAQALMQSYWPEKPSTGHAALVDLTLNYNFNEIISKYDLNDYIILIIFKNKSDLRVLSRINLNNNLILLNKTFEKQDINKNLFGSIHVLTIC